MTHRLQVLPDQEQIGMMFGILDVVNLCRPGALPVTYTINALTVGAQRQLLYA